MTIVAYLGVALLAFVVLVAVLGVLPVLLCRRVVGTPANRRSSTLRVLQSNVAMLAVIAAAGVFLGVSQLLSSPGAQPLFAGMAAAGVAIAATSIATYIWLERQIS